MYAHTYMYAHTCTHPFSVECRSPITHQGHAASALSGLCPKQNLHEHGASHLRHLGSLPSVCVQDRHHCWSWDGHNAQAGPEQTWPWCGCLKEFVTCSFDRDSVAHDLRPFSEPDGHTELKEKSSSGIKPFSSTPTPSLHILK